MADRIQLRRDTKANWEQYNPILLEGEPGHVLDYPNFYKMGDGVHAWNDLPYRGYDGTMTQNIQDDTDSVPSNAAIYANNRIDESKIEAILGGVFIDYSHCVSVYNGTYKYVSSDVYDCLWIPILKGSTKIGTTGVVDNYAYRFFSSFDTIDTTTFVGQNTTGVVLSGAVVCIRSLKKENYPDGHGNIVVTQDNSYVQRIDFDSVKENTGLLDKMTRSLYPNLIYIDNNHQCNYDENGNFIGYIETSNRDSAWVIVPSDADHINIKGVEEVGFTNFFSDFKPTADSYISHNSTGNTFIPTGTKLVIIHFSHSGNPSGLGNLTIETCRSTLRDKQNAINILKGGFVDYFHICETNVSAFIGYNKVSNFNCIWCPVSDDDYAVVPNGVTTNTNISFFSGLVPSADNYLGRSEAGLVITGARLALINISRVTNTAGLNSLEIVKVKKSFEGRDFYLLHNRTVSVDTGIKNFVRSENYDLIIVPINNSHISSINIKINGAVPEYSYRYFDDCNISEEHYLGTNRSGVLLSNTKIVTLAIKKSTYPNGYGVSFDKDYAYQPISPTPLESRKMIRMLLIGNSATDDALSYVPFIMQNMGIDVDFQIGILMKSSSSLQVHINDFENEQSAYKFRFYNGGTSWTNGSAGANDVSIQWALDNYEWDIISLQQINSLSYTETDYLPQCNKLINLISNYVDYPIKFIWYQTHKWAAKSNGGVNWSDAEIAEKYEGIATASDTILQNTVCEYVVPVGTAIQNARSISALKALGDYANNQNNTSGNGYLNYLDGVHLQEGLPCQIAAYTFILAILDIYGFKEYSINGETTRVTSDWTLGKNIPSPHGSPIGSTDANCLIAQKCAIMAIKHPYEVTDMNNIVNPT